MLKEVKIAIIGCGRISEHHCLSILEVDNVSFIAVCDLELSKAEVFGAKFNTPSYTNYREMLDKHPEINTVVVATPSGMHYEHAIELMQKYRKNIIIEKPTFMLPEQVKESYAIAKKFNLKIFPVFQNRYNRAVQRVKKAVTNGELGDIRVMAVRVRWCRPQRYYNLAPWRGTFSHDGGALTNQGIHHVDLLRYLGGEVESISSKMTTLGANIEVEDTVVSILKYKEAVGSLEVTTAARPDDFEASISIVGSKGVAQIGGIAVNELQIFTPDPEECSKHSEDFSEGIGVYGNGHQKMYSDIIQTLISNEKFPVDYSDCLKTIELLNAFYCSDESNGKWINPIDGMQSKRLGRPDNDISDLYRTG